MDEIKDEKTAKKPGRKGFNRMLERIEKGEAQGIISWHPDRLSRNRKDSERIMDLLEQHTLDLLRFQTFWFENNAQGRRLLSMEFVDSRFYIERLAENTKRGLRKKVRLGECPRPAPWGYLNDTRAKRWVIDPRLAPAVKGAFELYAEGEATLEDVSAFLARNGVLSRSSKRFKGGQPLARARITKLLQDPCYYGHFRYTGELHEGTHEPIITKALFDRVQVVFSRRWPTAGKPRVSKVFLGLFRCDDCGGAITAEAQKGHIYYRCTKKRRQIKCSQPYVREEALTREIDPLLSPFSISLEEADLMLRQLEKDRAIARAAAHDLAMKARAKATEITLQLDEVLSLLLSHQIDREMFVQRKSALLAEKKAFEEAASELKAGRVGWIEPMRQWLLTAQRIDEIVKSGTLDAKRALAREIYGSNLLLAGGKALGKAVEPWSLVTATRRGDTRVPIYELARTYFTMHFPS